MFTQTTLLPDEHLANLRAGTLAGIAAFVLIYFPTLEHYAIDDLLGLTPGPGNNAYADNLVPKGRYIAFLFSEAFEAIGINIYPSYPVLLLATQVAIGVMITMFAALFRVPSPWLVALLTLAVSASPQNFELMHFRHGIVIDAATYGGTALLVLAYLRGLPRPWLIAPAVLMLGGYTSSLPILLSCLAFFAILDLQAGIRTLPNTVLGYGLVLLAALGIHYAVTSLLTSAYGMRASQSVAGDFGTLAKTWKISWSSMKYVTLRSVYSTIPTAFHMCVAIVAMLAVAVTVRRGYLTAVALGLGTLVILTNFFNLYILPFEINYLPGRSYLHVQVITAVSLIVLWAAVSRTWARRAVLFTAGVAAVVFGTVALDHSNGLAKIRGHDHLVAGDFVAALSEYDAPPRVYVHFDGRSVRQRERQDGTFGDLKSLFYASWSRYRFLERSGMPATTPREKDADRIETFAAECDARRQEMFSHSIVRGEDHLYLCL